MTQTLRENYSIERTLSLQSFMLSVPMVHLFRPGRHAQSFIHHFHSDMSLGQALWHIPVTQYSGGRGNKCEGSGKHSKGPGKPRSHRKPPLKQGCH